MIALPILFFLSGAVGLVYEVVWTRALADILGSTAWSMTAVFAVFLAGLAVGAEAWGRGRVSGDRALRRYALLEVTIGVTATASFLLLRSAGPWIAAASPPVADPWASGAFAVAVAVPFVGVPAFFMGGTLPVILSAATQWTTARAAVPVLYGWNTLGAACGALATGFLLIWWLGLQGTVLAAAGVNLAVAGAALWMAARGPSEPEPGSEPDLGSSPSVEAPPSPPSVEGSSGVPTRLWVTLAFTSGAGTLALEVLWGRVARFVLGDRTLAVAALLFVFVSALGAGSFLAPLVARRLGTVRPAQALVLAAGAMLMGTLAHVLFVPLGLWSAGGGGLTALAQDAGTVGRLLVVLLLIFPGVTLLGLVFPLLAWSVAELEVHPGRVLGRLYLVNTAGAVTGAGVAGLFLAAWVGTPRGFLVVMVAMALVALWVMVRVEGGRRWRVWATAGVAVMVVGGLFFPRDMAFLREGERLVDTREDAYGVQVLASVEGTDHLRVRNNRLSLIFDLGSPDTRHAQETAAHFTALLAGDVGRVLNVGTGYGITAGAYTLYPGVQQLETVEILPFLVDAQDAFAAHNYNYTADPRVTLIQGDGRHYLAASEGTYDIVSVNVLDPYLPGSSSLYTVEFWSLVRSRLAPGGVFTQLFWGEDVDLLVRGLRQVFPTVLLFEAYGGTSYNVVAFRDEVSPETLPVHLDRLGPRARRAFEEVVGVDAEEGMPRLLELAWTLSGVWAERADQAEGPLHTDDRPVLEFRWATGTPGASPFDSPLVVH